MNEAFIFIFGLIIGSFLNALIYRLGENLSVAEGRSFCPSCKHPLAAKDLIPIVSFLLLRGRCRYCKAPISIQYPIVEATTGLLFLLVYEFALAQASGFDVWILFSGYAAITSLLVVTFVFDLTKYLIADSVMLAAAIIAFLLQLWIGEPLGKLALAVAVGAGFFALQYAVTLGRGIGAGDIELGAVMGLILSWPGVVTALAIAYGVGGAFAVALLLTGRAKRGAQIPFGAFLAPATFIAMLYGNAIVEATYPAMFL